jgi:tape measure domain-containing protein
MATVDNKVVSLEFNNSRFNANVQSTMSALDRLKEKLGFKGGTKGFDDVQRAADQVKVDNISQGIEGVSKGFLAMSAIAATALSRITNAAITSGSQIAKALTITPLKDGFAEFELGMKSTQTILANTADAGKTLDDVTGALTELNQYSDKTIYNFGQMASNIGKMTAAGVDLDTAVDAVKGLSNVAALFGADAQSAAGATYQLSQAMSAGVVKAQDWISVSNANMGGAALQESLFETGKMMGTLKDVDMSTTFDEWSKSSGGFKGSLESGWLTTDVLNTTLKGFTGDYTAAQLSAMGYSDEQAMKMEELGKRATASATDVLTFTQLLQVTAEAMGTGWSDSFKLIFGDFKEAKKLFTNLNTYISGIIGNSAKGRNAVLEDWRAGGGRETLIQGMLYAWEDVLSILRPIGKAFREVFPKKTGDDLLKMTTSFRDLFKNFKIGEGVTKAIQSGFTAFFSVIKAGFTIVGFLVKAFFKVVGAVGAFVNALAQAGGGAVMAFFRAIGDLFKTLTSGAGGAATGALDGLASGAAKLGTWLGNLLSNLSGVTERIKEFTKSLTSSDEATGKAEKSTSRFAGVIEFFKSVFAGIGSFFSSLFSGVSSFGELVGNVMSSIVDALSNLGSGMSDAFGDINWNTVFGAVGVGAGVALVKKIRQLLDAPIEMLDAFSESIRGVLDGVADILNGFAAKLKSEALETAAKAILKMAIAMAILTAALVVLASLDPARLAQAVATMAGLFAAMQKTMSSLITMQLPSGAQLFGLGVALLGIAGAIFLLSISMKKIQDLDNGDIAAGLTTITVLLAGLSAAAEGMKGSTEELFQAGLGMVAMAVAVVILSSALEKLASLDPVKALAGALAAATAITAMTLALKQIDEKQAKAKGFAFLSMGLAVNLFAMAVEKFGNMKLSMLGTGMAAIAALLAGLTVFFNALPDNMILVAAEILIISVAMNIMAKAVEAFGTMGWDAMIQGLVGIAGALGIMAIAAQVMNSAIVGAGAVVIMAVGLTLLAGAVATFGQMGVDTMIKSLLGIAAVLVIIAAGGALMGAISPLLLAGGAAFVVLGLGMLLFGAGAWLAATAILALAGASAVGVKNAISAFKEILKALPEFAAALALGFIEGIKTILDAIPGLAGSIGAAVESLLNLLIDLATGFIAENGDDIAQAGFDMLKSLMKGIRDNLGEIIMLTAEIIVEYINGLADAINEKSEEIGEAGRKLAGALIAGLINVLVPKEIQEKIGELVDGMVNKFKEMLGINSPSTVFLGFGGDILAGLLNGLTAAVTGIITFFWELPGKIIEALGDLLSFLIPKGAELLGGFLSGLGQKLLDVALFFITLPFKVLEFIGDVLSTLINKGKELLGGLLTGLVEKLPGIKDWLVALPGKVVNFIGNVLGTLAQKGSDLLTGLKNGAELGIEAVKTWFTNMPTKIMDTTHAAVTAVIERIKSVGGRIINGIKQGISDAWEGFTSWFGDKISSIPGVAEVAAVINSPSKIMMPIGKHLVGGVQAGMSKQFPKAEKEISKGMLDLVASAQAAAVGVIDKDINPTITPVLDLSMVEAKARTLGDLLGIDSLTTDMSYINAQQIATTKTEKSSPDDSVGGSVTNLSFVQNNNSPKALSTGDIYRGQKSQIALAKKELGLVS